MVTNRNGIVLCYNNLNEIVCIYILFIYGDVTYDIIDLFNETNIKINKKLDKLKYNNKIKEKCSICQENMKRYIKLKCCHNFHKSCLKEWLKIKQNCPLCRKSFIDETTKLIEVKNRYNLIEHKYFEKKCILKNKKIINIVMVLIKLTFKKFERYIKMSLQFINLSSAVSLSTENKTEDYECIEDLDEEIKGKYCKEKLSKIIEYKKKILFGEFE